MHLSLYLRFSTKYGQTLYVSGNHVALGMADYSKAIPMQYFNDEWWHVDIEILDGDLKNINYHYLLREEGGNEVIEWGDDRMIDLKKNNHAAITCFDTWNHAGSFENTFFTKPFQEVLLSPAPLVKTKVVKNCTHIFRVKAPLLKDNEVLCIGGSGKSVGSWNAEDVMLMHKMENWWTIQLDLSKESFPFAYKYGVYDLKNKKLVRYESRDNRLLHGDSSKGKLTILHDGFAQCTDANWKGAGVAIPVFSLRSAHGFGTGEFTDIHSLVDWAADCGIKLIQLLPVNDTTATHTQSDSYPYAAISAFALHPLYLNVEKLFSHSDKKIKKEYDVKRQELNKSDGVDYPAVMQNKWEYIRTVFQENDGQFLEEAEFKIFFKHNHHWLVPYAAFCFFRDEYNTSDYNQWPSHSKFDLKEINKISKKGSRAFDIISMHYFVQYHLHLQLKEATDYAHQNKVIVKGDLPIGIYRYSCDAWVSPELYNMEAQAGAPPDDFAVKGQNWGFPTYNWKQMQMDGFAWWRKRFEQMSVYFDAFRIDHILGFFRIWSIPLHAVEGIMGRFVPAIPIHISELTAQHILFNRERFCAPFITNQILEERFGVHANYVKDFFLDNHGQLWRFKNEFDTQRKIEHHFAGLEQNEHHQFLLHHLFDLISNVIFFADEQQVDAYHFRIGMENTSSFSSLDNETKEKLKQLYVNYFYQRQDDFWRKEAMQKLPGLKRSTNMLVCGEDLGMVPGCVPQAMDQLGILSLEIQRMPKQTNRTFFHPADAPYLSVVTPSTHDMSTIRGWWEEDIQKTQEFFNRELGHMGKAPNYCEGYINEEVVKQHLHSPAMWAIFQLQDLLGMDDKFRRSNPNEERINVPANPNHYWRYRMHLDLEELKSMIDFNANINNLLKESFR